MPSFWVTFFIAMLGSVLTVCPAMAQPNVDELLSALRLQPPVLLCGEEVPVDLPQVMERFEKEMLLSLNNRAQVILWLKRSPRLYTAWGTKNVDFSSDSSSQYSYSTRITESDVMRSRSWNERKNDPLL